MILGQSLRKNGFSVSRNPQMSVLGAQAFSALRADSSLNSTVIAIPHSPNGGAVTPSAITPGRFGTVPRHYIRTTQDNAVPLAGQDHMIAAVDRTIGGTTITHTLESSHSPFLSQPAALSRMLLDISAQSSADA